MATELVDLAPQTLPISVPQYQTLVDHGCFDGRSGQTELIRGEIVHMNPQGPVHSDPIDELQQWSYEVAADQFRIRIEKPLEFVSLNSCPEPDVAWVTKGRYAAQHPTAQQVHLLIEVSKTSKSFDRGEKMRLYAEAGIPEYWVVDVAGRTVEVMTDPNQAEYQKRRLHPISESIVPLCLPAAQRQESLSPLQIARLFG